MLYLVLGALWAWGVMFPIPGAAAEALPSLAVQQPAALPTQQESPAIVGQLMKRQYNSTASVCKAYGVDYQDGGSYFVDQRSMEPFQAVTKFEGCQNSEADVLLVNRQTAQQYSCGKIPTTPDDKPQMATCEIKESDMKSGNWSLLILGDNALKGKPFAYQRDFSLNVAPQQTVTVSKTCVYTYTEKSTTTMTSTYTLATTNTIPNKQIVTKPAATNVVTITPKPSTAIATQTTTRTFTTWTRTESKCTVVATHSCAVPPKPMLPDSMCKILPTIKPVPQGVSITSGGQEQKIADRRAVDVQGVRKRFENHAAASIRMAASSAAAPPVPAGPVTGLPATVTMTARTPINSTITTTLPVKTMQAISTKTKTVVVAATPKTIYLGTTMQTTYAPAETKTQYRKAFTRVYEVQTMSVQWTWTSTKEACATETGQCRAKGGFMG